jgi:prepilin-type N-terminal cleavage/methylation domain-containing protein
MDAPKRGTRGFTLVELAVVVVIMGVLAAGALARYNISAHRSHEKEADLALAQLYRMQEVHRNEHGAYASSEAELARVGFVPPVLRKFVWAGSVEVPQCLESTGRWSSRRITAEGALEDC